MLTNNKTNLTYTVIFCNNNNPEITFKQTNLSVHMAFAAMDILSKAFRSCDIVSEDTGAIIASVYTAAEFFTPTLTLTEAVDAWTLAQLTR